jgi:hypothetical protein
MACSDCVTEVDTCMTHGTTFTQDVELLTGYEDYQSLGYQGKLTICDFEGGPSLKTVISAIDPENFLTFTLDPDETEALPRYDLWYQVDLFTVTDVQRIYQGDVTMNL